MTHSSNLTGKHLMKVGKDGMAFIRLSDCKLLLEMFCTHRSVIGGRKGILSSNVC